MEQWRNLIHINRNFQKAVNLQLDIGSAGSCLPEYELYHTK